MPIEPDESSATPAASTLTPVDYGWSPEPEATLDADEVLSTLRPIDVTISQGGGSPVESSAQDHGPVVDFRDDEQGEKYRLRCEIARGGMGVVLEAQDTTLYRNVALKAMISPRDASRQRVLRFIEEARITAQLQHPGILPIYELGMDKSGNIFYTMKRVAGRTLHDILKSLKNGDKETAAEYPLGRLITLLQRVCDAVAYAHSKGVIHRDLKPDNIMIGDYGEVLVLDWGLAKVLKRRTGSSLESNTYKTEIITLSDVDGLAKAAGGEVEETDSLLATLDGNAIGTPGYMAPEQARGQVGRMDEKSDIYSLGAILYHILALEPTIRRESDTSRQALLRKISEGSIVPLKESRRIPKPLIVVAMKALSMRPKDRYQTVKKFQADLDAHLGGFATSAEDLSVLALITLFVRRHLVASLVTLTMVILVVAGGSVNYSERVTAQKASARAEQALLNLKATAPAIAFLADSHLQRQEMEEALKIITNAIELVPESAEYHNTRGNILQTMHRFKEACEEYGHVLQLVPGDKNATENLEICQTIGAEPQKLFLALRKQNRLHEAVNVIMPLTKRPLILSVFLKEILESENVASTNYVLDNLGRCAITLGKDSDLSHYRAFPITELTLSGPVSNLAPLVGMPLTVLNVPGSQIRDLSPLKGMRLTSLTLTGSPFLRDLSPLKGMPLTELNLRGCGEVSDLSPLKEAPLTMINLCDCRKIFDVSPLAGMKIKDLDLGWTQVGDLRPLKGMPLTSLSLSYCHSVTNLSSIAGMPLTFLSLHGNKSISDLSPLRGMPLTSISLAGCSGITDFSPLAGLTSLRIDGVLVDEFIKRLDAR